MKKHLLKVLGFVVLVAFILGSMCNAAVVWGIDKNSSDVYFYSGGVFKKVESSALKYIAVGPQGAVWGIDVNTDGVLFRDGISAATPMGIMWRDVDVTPVKMKQLAVGLDVVWSTDASGKVYFREDITSYNPMGSRWTEITGQPLVSVAVGSNFAVWGLDASNNIYFREGASLKNPKGTAWTKIEGLLKEIAVGRNGNVYAVGLKGELYYREGVTAAVPKGTKWTQVVVTEPILTISNMTQMVKDAVVSIKCLNNGKYLQQPIGQKAIVATADNADAPIAQFKVLKDQSFIGFTAASGDNVQANANGPERGLRADGKNFLAWEQWVLEDGAYLKYNADQIYKDTPYLVVAADGSLSATASKDKASKFSIQTAGSRKSLTVSSVSASSDGIGLLCVVSDTNECYSISIAAWDGRPHSTYTKLAGTLKQIETNGFIAAEVDAASVRGSVSIKYNSLIALDTTMWPEKALWTLAGARIVGSNNFVIGVGGAAAEKRDESGAQLFMLRKVGDQLNRGPVKYGDTFEIISVFGALDKDPAAAGLYPKGKKWWVNTTSRYLGTPPTYHEIFVSDPSKPETTSGKQMFSFVSANGSVGAVMEGDITYITSQSPESKDKMVWVYGGLLQASGASVAGVNELLVGDPYGRDYLQGRFTVDAVDKEEAFAVAYDAIKNSPLFTTPVVLPADWVPEIATGQRVSVGAMPIGATSGGLTESDCLAVIIDTDDDSLKVMDLYSTAQSPFVDFAAKTVAGTEIGAIKDVAVSSSGVMYILDAMGRAYTYDWAKKAFVLLATEPDMQAYAKMEADLWSKGISIPPMKPSLAISALKLDYIAAGNRNGKEELWGVSIDAKNVYRFDFTKKAWEVKGTPGSGKYVSIGADGTVVMLNVQGRAFVYNWDIGQFAVEMQGITLNRIAVAKADLMYGVVLNGEKYELWQYDGKAWARVKDATGKDAEGLVEIAVNAAGTAFGLDAEGDLYHKGEAGVKQLKIIPLSAAEIAALTAAGKPVQKDKLEVTPVEPKKETRVAAQKAGKIKKTDKKTGKTSKAASAKAKKTKKETATVTKAQQAAAVKAAKTGKKATTVKAPTTQKAKKKATSAKKKAAKKATQPAVARSAARTTTAPVPAAVARPVVRTTTAPGVAPATSTAVKK